MTDGRPWVPVPLARGIARRGRRRPITSRPRPGLRSCARAARRSTPRSPRTRCSASSRRESCGLGGDAFWLIWDAAEGRQVALNGSGRCAATADAAGLRDAGLDAMPMPGPARDHRARRRAVVGRRPSPVRTAVTATRSSRPPSSWPATAFPAYRRASSTRSRRWRSWRERRPVRTPASSRSSDRRVGRWRPGERLRLPALAATLETLAREGFDAFYDGDLGERQACDAGGGRLADPRRRPPVAHLDLGRADRPRLSRCPRHDPSAEQLGHRRARDPRDPRAVRAAARRGLRARRRHRRALDPPRHRGGQARDGRPRRRT